MTTTTYRRLFRGELIEDGDEWQDPQTGQWHEAHVTGRTVGIPGRTNYDYRRPVVHVQPMAAVVEVLA